MTYCKFARTAGQAEHNMLVFFALRNQIDRDRESRPPCCQVSLAPYHALLETEGHAFAVTSVCLDPLAIEQPLCHPKQYVHDFSEKVKLKSCQEMCVFPIRCKTTFECPLKRFHIFGQQLDHRVSSGSKTCSEMFFRARHCT